MFAPFSAMFDFNLWCIYSSYGEYKLILGSPGYSDGWQQDKSVGLRVGDNSVVPVFRFLRWAPDRSDKCPFTRILPYNFTLLGISSKYGRTLTDRTELYNVYGIYFQILSSRSTSLIVIECYYFFFTEHNQFNIHMRQIIVIELFLL